MRFVVWPIFALVLITAGLFPVQRPQAHEMGTDPDAAWFQSLRNGGADCCNMHDCHRTDAVQISKEGHYLVKLRDQWVFVEQENVLHIPNPTGMAVECHTTDKRGFDVPYIRCFIPGTMA
ncbi:MAG: hypothetical protein JOZ58_23665 [Acetobacteraceae bacterium]|nr:hypothetical protein [Acetobacteraceae bacterium]MBV8578015.1 hypothetical protein [Acetobacteraceae bacterium]